MDKYLVRNLFDAKIYALTDVEENIFYVGCTLNSLKKRRAEHIKGSVEGAAYSRGKKAQKIRSLNYDILIQELCSFGVFGLNKREAQINAFPIEKIWVDKMLSDGHPLCNVVHVTKPAKLLVKKPKNKKPDPLPSRHFLKPC